MEEISVWQFTNLSVPKEMMYLQTAIEDGTAKNAVEELSHSGDNYEQGIDCLSQGTTDLDLFSAHKCSLYLKILYWKKAPLRSSVNYAMPFSNMLEHWQQLDVTSQSNSSPQWLSLKFDTDTLSEWQRHSQAETDVQHYDDLLQFIDLKAQALEVPCSMAKKHTNTSKKALGRVVSHATNSAEKNCVANFQDNAWEQQLPWQWSLQTPV